MHQPDSNSRPSLYYRYQVHEPWVPPSVADLTTDSAPDSATDSAPDSATRTARPCVSRIPVLIVGAGPAGLVTALMLAHQDVASVVLSEDLQVSAGSRAIVFTRRTMEILHQLGVAQRMLERGLPWRFGSSFYRGQEVFRMQAPHPEDDRHGPMLNLQQQYLEQYLLEACAEQPLISVRWGNRWMSLEQDAHQVHALIDTPNGPYTQPCDWLVAADGGRSAIRAALGLRMEGASYEGLFVIADIRVDLPYPTERRAYFDPPWNPGNTILMHREPEGIWRIDYQLPAGESPEQALRPEALRQRIDAQLEMIGHAGTPWQLDWSSVYSARTLTLPAYLHDRVLFAGDAAHLLPIFGVRGANTAFQDAQALGWQLGLVCKGLASPSLLENYSEERVGAAREIIEEAGKSTRFMTPPSRGFKLLRDAVLSLSLTQEFVRPLYHWRTSRPHEYTHSRLNTVDDNRPDPGCHDAPSAGSQPCFDPHAGLRPGAPPRDVRLAAGRHLLDHTGTGFCLLVAGSLDEAPVLDAESLSILHAWRARGLKLRVLAIDARAQSEAASGQTESAPVPHQGAAPVAVVGADLTLRDPEGRVARVWGLPHSGACVLLRPDQHVVARWMGNPSGRLHAALCRATQCLSTVSNDLH